MWPKKRSQNGKEAGLRVLFSSSNVVTLIAESLFSYEIKEFTLESNINTETNNIISLHVSFVSVVHEIGIHANVYALHSTQWRTQEMCSRESSRVFG